MKMPDITLSQGLQECAQNTQSDGQLISCTREIITTLLRAHSTNDLMNELRDTQVPYAYKGCHSVAHLVGEQTYAKYGNIEESLAQCTASCFSGCTHGVLGAAVAETVHSQGLADNIAHLDVSQIETIGTKYCTNLQLCHGIGHVLYLILLDFNKATFECSKISSGHALHECAAGVYMQGAAGIGDSLILGNDVPAAAVQPNRDYAYPCDAAPEAYQHDCYAYLVPFQENTTAQDGPQDSAARLRIARTVCEGLNDTSRSYCFEGIGKFAGDFRNDISISSFDPINAKICENLSTITDKKSCILGYVYTLINYQYEKQAINLCSSMSPELRDFCFTANFSYFGPGAFVTPESACMYANATDSCKNAFTSYERYSSTLPDYRFGLYGEI